MRVRQVCMYRRISMASRASRWLCIKIGDLNSFRSAADQAIFRLKRSRDAGQCGFCTYSARGATLHRGFLLPQDHNVGAGADIPQRRLGFRPHNCLPSGCPPHADFHYSLRVIKFA
jgi:hypothetical protein